MYIMVPYLDENEKRRLRMELALSGEDLRALKFKPYAVVWLKHELEEHNDWCETALIQLNNGTSWSRKPSS